MLKTIKKYWSKIVFKGLIGRLICIFGFHNWERTSSLVILICKKCGAIKYENDKSFYLFDQKINHES